MNCPIMQKTILNYVNGMLQQRGDCNPVNAYDALITSGRLQSIDVVELASWLAKEYHLDYLINGFNQYDFDSVNAMMDMIEVCKRS